MTPESTIILSEFRTIVQDDALFSEFLNSITNKNFFTLLSRIDGSLEDKFRSCIRTFIQSIVQSGTTDASLFRAQLRTDFGCGNESILFVPEMDCFPGIEAFRGFPGFLKTIEYINSSFTKKLRLVCFLPNGVKRCTFVSNGVLPLDSTNTAIDPNICAENKPLMRLLTVERTAVYVSISSEVRCDVLIIIRTSRDVIACSRINHNGHVKLVAALQGNIEYHINAYSTLNECQHTVSVSSLSDPHTCKILN